MTKELEILGLSTEQLSEAWNACVASAAAIKLEVEEEINKSREVKVSELVNDLKRNYCIFIHRGLEDRDAQKDT